MKNGVKYNFLGLQALMMNLCFLDAFNLCQAVYLHSI